MQFIRHRVNQISDLKVLEKSWGAEIDLRSSVNEAGSIHLAHDPWQKGDSFAEWLCELKRLQIDGPLILNTKEDGLEGRICDLLHENQIRNEVFFLDTTFPTLMRWSLNGKAHLFSLRVSKFEKLPAETANLNGLRWLWIDCFGGEPISDAEVKSLKRDFKICLVSPELQAKPLDSISKFQELAALADAICTKDPNKWKFFLKI